ncbi:hypothetical protein ACS0TY_001426 [Phlomoides rotata]
MSREKLLDIEPDQELSFHIEVGKQASSAIRLCNNSQNHVAFKFMSSNPRKMLYVRPRTEIISPRSCCDVEVTMAAPEEAPSDMQCNDNILIKSVVVHLWYTVEQSQQLFKKNKYEDGDWKLRVVYVLSNHDRSGEEGASLNGSTVQERSLNDTEQQDRNGRRVGDLLTRGLTIVFLCLIFGYILVKMLPIIWSLTFMITVFVINMGRRVVSDSIQDWIARAMFYLCFHWIQALFQRRAAA